MGTVVFIWLFIIRPALVGLAVFAAVLFVTLKLTGVI